MKPATIIEMRNFILSKGFEVLPIRKGDVYKVVVFRGDKFMGEGKFEYKSWQDALETTEQDFYAKLNKL